MNKKKNGAHVAQMLRIIMFLCVSSIACLSGMEEGASGLSLDVVKKFILPKNVTSFCFNPETRTLAYTHRDRDRDRKNIIKFIDMDNLQTLKAIKTGNSIVYSCFDIVSNQVGMITDSGKVCLLDWVNSQPIKTLHHDNVFVSLAFAQKDCFAVTKKGALFCAKPGMGFEPIFSLPNDYDGFPFTILSLSSGDDDNKIALVGHDQKGKGTVDIVTVNDDTIGYTNGYTTSPVVKSCFSNNKTLIALAHGMQVIVFNVDNSRGFVKSFDYSCKVAAVCFDPTDTAFFAGLEDGSIFYSDLYVEDEEKNEKYVMSEEDSTFLYCLCTPIRILSYVKEGEKLCAITWKKVVLFNFVFNSEETDDTEETEEAEEY